MVADARPLSLRTDALTTASSTVDNPDTIRLSPECDMPSRRTLLWSAFVPVALALTVTARGAAAQIPDIDGRTLTLFEPAGTANVIFFVATDCPISNSYAPEIQRVCREYRPRGVGCALVYRSESVV